MMRRLTLAAVFAGALATSAAPALPVAAETLKSEPAASRTIYVPKDKSMSFRLESRASKIVIAQPDIAEIVATTDQSFYVRGVDFGSTNLLVYGPGGRLMQVIDVRVGYDAAALEQDLRAALPGERIAVTNLGQGLLLSGEASGAGVAKRARAIAERFTGSPEAVASVIAVRAGQQVVLEVRVLEASRSALQDLGMNVAMGNSSFQVNSAGGLVGGSAPASVIQVFGGKGRTNIDVTLQALENKGVIRTLAKPNLVALSGEKASFLAGGEFPFPVPNGQNGVTIDFREYGVKLAFQPVVEDNGLINMIVQPEVSQLDFTNAIRLAGFDVPGLTVRRAATTVEIRPGDSFAIAGLFQRDFTNSVNQTPVLGNIPVLGALFRSARWRRAETELMIVVTPRLATAADLEQPPPEKIPGREVGALDMFLTGTALDRPVQAPAGSK